MNPFALLRRLLRRGAYHMSRGGLGHAIAATARESRQRIFGAFAAQGFARQRKLRARRFGDDLSGLRCPAEPGLVSIVLPVYNGGGFLAEAIDSVLAQDYAQFELIAVNDGSTDDTARILAEYSQRDARLQVVHQENRKLPRTLSRGFHLARGELFTWTSADNRWRPQYLRKMVDCLSRHRDWDMIYANEDLIDAHGAPLVGSDHFAAHQTPPGSEHIHFPEDSTWLNVLADNYVGAAFLYRSRVAHLLGDYSRFRFTVEDYDYSMRVNALLRLHHADFREPLYEYRFHNDSLTARIERDRHSPAPRVFDGQLQLERLMRFDALRRKLFVAPMAWRIEDRSGSAATIAAALLANVRAADWRRGEAEPHLPVLYACFENPQSIDRPPPSDLPPSTVLKALILAQGELPQTSLHADWDVCIALGNGAGPAQPLPRLGVAGYKGLLWADDLRTLFHALDVRCRSAQAQAVEAQFADR